MPVINTPLEALQIEPQDAPRAAIIMLHGLGADGHDFEPLNPDIDLPESLPVRWVLPHAPIRPVALNGGEHMRAWYDITSLDIFSEEDETGIRGSAAALGECIRVERDRGMPAQRIVMAGFSQGGAMALFTALRWPERLGGVIALSTYLPLHATLAAEARTENDGIPVFMAHGTSDPIVPFKSGEKSRDLLMSKGCAVTWRAYQMQHSLCVEEVADLRAWLLSVLGPA
jgi:phospholipase/carboxylesterase